jgi:acetylornithine deacetylase
VVMSCTVNEEHGFTGASALAGSWRAAAGDAVTGDAAASGAVTGGAAADVFTRRPDAAVVAEPTELAVVVAHKGTVRWRCRTLGRAVHSSRPELGDNAIYHMARVLAALEQYQARIAPTLAAHPLCGRPSLSVGVIRGGISVNTVPDACEIEIDRRVLPGEDPVRARQEVIDHLAADPSLAGRVEHDPPFIETRGLTDRANGPLAAELIAAAGERIGRPEPIGVLFGTDAVALEAAGVPTVVFGPGSIEQAHTNDEWVEVEQVRRAADVLFDFARGFRAAAVPAGA